MVPAADGTPAPSVRPPFALTVEQRARLQELRAAHEEGEGEERLNRLRQREEDLETLRAIGRLLAEADLEGGGGLNREQTLRLLALVRALAPNPNLDSRLLQRPDEPERFHRDLQDLLYGPASLPVRLEQFLARRHAGGQTALQLLCAAFPTRFPLITPSGLRTLALSPEQRAGALETARQRFYPAPLSEATPPLPDRSSAAVLTVLADLIVYEAAHDLLDAPDYLALHRLLSPSQPARSEARRLAHLTGLPYRPYASVHAPHRPDYQIEATPPENHPVAPPDLTGLRMRDLLQTIEAHIAAQGFTYPSLTVRDYALCLQSRSRLTLLSGLSGTGKTRLSSLFAEALTSDTDTHYRLLPVRPDWADSAPLLGYVNLLAAEGGRFVSTPFLEFLLRASRPENAWQTFFLCLDEMNLARIEHYFAEILSAMETAERAVLLPNGHTVRLPDNLFFTGTLNTDEGTRHLSRKVLDRANTLQFQEVSLRDAPASGDRPVSPSIWPPALRQALFLQSRIRTPAAARKRLQELGPASPGSNGAAPTERSPAVQADGPDLLGRVIDALSEVNEQLEPHDLHFAYRVRDEILIYCANSFDVDGVGLLAPETDVNLRTALDLQLTQRVLPRLTGTQEQIEPAARELLRWAQHGGYPHTARRLTRLLTRLQRDGFYGLE